MSGWQTMEERRTVIPWQLNKVSHVFILHLGPTIVWASGKSLLPWAPADRPSAACLRGSGSFHFEVCLTLQLWIPCIHPLKEKNVADGRWKGFQVSLDSMPTISLISIGWNSGTWPHLSHGDWEVGQVCTWQKGQWVVGGLTALSHDHPTF